jgi:hypothetical protein
MVQQMMKTNSTSSSMKYVDHTYRDFSRYVEEGGELAKHKKSANNFPARLHKILSETDPDHSDVITWMVSPESLFVFVIYIASVQANLSQHLALKLDVLFSANTAPWPRMEDS